MPSLTITNQKGGVGKTTTTLNLAAALQDLGVRVLVVDFDPQGSLTTSCGLSDPTELGPGQTIADALLTTMHHPGAKAVSIQDVIVKTPAGLDLVPSNHELASAERILYAVYGREFALRDTLAPIRTKYDLILIDSVPTLGLLAINSLAAVDGLVIPVQAEFLAVHGLAQVLDSVKQVRERLNPSLQIWGVALTMVDGRTKHSHDIIQLVRESLVGQVPVFKTEIPTDVKLKESSRLGMSVIRMDGRARSARAYRELAKEVAIMVPAAKASAFETEPVLAPPEAPVSIRQSAPTGKATANDESTAATTAAPTSTPTDGEAARKNGTVAPRIDNAVPVVPAAPRKADSNGKPAPPTPRLPGVCPYLGLIDAPYNHSSQPADEHRCFVANPALQIARREQHVTCLTIQHQNCDRYFRATLNSVMPPVAPKSATSPDDGEQSSVFSRLKKIVFR
ncbi:MAG TPA: ParA family protein [Chloroflexota bacterium]|nr:ParA family protein [Chloroflexota bacterium]